MTRNTKYLTVALWIIAVTMMVWVVAIQLWTRDRQSAQAALVIGLPATLGPQSEPFAAPDFALTDQQGRTVTTNDLKGHPWIADFIFTECAASCPAMTAHLAQLQSKIPPEVKFVSFSVDPERDTPAVLLAYAKKYEADNNRWRFLTGSMNDVLAAVQGMKTAIIPATKDSPLGHDTHYILMDSTGRLKDVYSSDTPSEIDRLTADANALAKAGLP